MVNLKNQNIILLALLYRQMSLSMYRHSNEEDFFEYFEKRLHYYEKGISMLYETAIYNQKNENYGYSFLDRLKSILIGKKVMKYEEILLLYKILKEFVEFVKDKNTDKDYRYLELARPSYIIYYDVLRKKITSKEKRIIDKVEHYGQNINLNLFSIKQILGVLK